jgi:polyisoprenoid-binding protein YceI
MKFFILFASFISFFVNTQAQVFIAKGAEIKFFSKTPMEDINAKSKAAGAALNLETKKVFVSVKMTSFVFPNALMQEHFNENYMESEKYPTAIFDGTIVDDKNQDLTKNGTYNVNVKGTLTLHGVIKEYNTPIKIEVLDGKIVGDCAFKVKLVDHKIEIPTMVIQNIAEVIDVSIHAIFEQKK